MSANRVIVCLLVICVIVVFALFRKGGVKANFYIPSAGFSLETTESAK